GAAPGPLAGALCATDRRGGGTALAGRQAGTAATAPAGQARHRSECRPLRRSRATAGAHPPGDPRADPRTPQRPRAGLDATGRTEPGAAPARGATAAAA